MNKNNTTISIPKSCFGLIQPLREFYSQKYRLRLTRGQTVSMALEAEFKRNVK